MHDALLLFLFLAVPLFAPVSRGRLVRLPLVLDVLLVQPADQLLFLRRIVIEQMVDGGGVALGEALGEGGTPEVVLAQHVRGSRRAVVAGDAAVSQGQGVVVIQEQFDARGVPPPGRPVQRRVPAIVREVPRAAAQEQPDRRRVPVGAGLVQRRGPRGVARVREGRLRGPRVQEGAAGVHLPVAGAVPQLRGGLVGVGQPRRVAEEGVELRPGALERRIRGDLGRRLRRRRRFSRFGVLLGIAAAVIFVADDVGAGRRRFFCLRDFHGWFQIF